MSHPDLPKAFRDICRLKVDKIEFIARGTMPEGHKVIVDERAWELKRAQIEFVKTET